MCDVEFNWTVFPSPTLITETSVIFGTYLEGMDAHLLTKL